MKAPDFICCKVLVSCSSFFLLVCCLPRVKRKGCHASLPLRWITHYWLAVWHSGSIVRRMNEVTLY